MGYSAIIRAVQQQRELKMGTLLELQFADGTQRVWDGVGPFTDVNGMLWSGLGELVTISAFDRSLTSAQPPTLVLSGVDRVLMTKVLQGRSLVQGRYFRIFDQYFDRDTMQPLEAPKCVLLGLMDRPSVDVTATTVTVSLSTTTVFHRRRRPALAYLSDATQQALHPGDTGADQLSRLVQATEIWPGYNG